MLKVSCCKLSVAAFLSRFPVTASSNLFSAITSYLSLFSAETTILRCLSTAAPGRSQSPEPDPPCGFPSWNLQSSTGSQPADLSSRSADCYSGFQPAIICSGLRNMEILGSSSPEVPLVPGSAGGFQADALLVHVFAKGV